MATVQKSVYKRGAEDGLRFGVFLSAMFLASVLSMTYPLLSWCTVAMFIVVPFLIYRYLRRGYVESFGTATFSALWLHGIVIFFCGSMISALVALVYLKWVQPGFILSTVRQVIDIYTQMDTDEAQEIASTLQKMIEQKLLPSPTAIAMQSIWTAVFTGSILSMIISAIVPIKKIKQ